MKNQQMIEKPTRPPPFRGHPEGTTAEDVARAMLAKRPPAPPPRRGRTES